MLEPDEIEKMLSLAQGALHRVSNRADGEELRTMVEDLGLVGLTVRLSADMFSTGWVLAVSNRDPWL